MPKKKAIPHPWPPNLTYLHSPIYSTHLTRSLLTALHSFPPYIEPPVPIQPPPSPCPLVKITPITNPTHPAYGQHGLFASQHLQPDTLIITYLGHVHLSSGSDNDPNSDYDLHLNVELGIDVDSVKMGNEARYINDYRGVNDKGPNAEFRSLWVDLGGGKVERRMGVFVLCAGKQRKRKGGIKKGEEILVSYGKGFWRARE